MGVTRTQVRPGKRFRKHKYKIASPWSRIDRGNDTSYRTRINPTRANSFGYPDKLVTNIRYVDTVSLTGGSGVVGANVFRMNGLNDPDASGLGHQPMYFDQFCGPAGTAPYRKYRVLGAKATVTFSMASPPAIAAANFGPVIVGLLGTEANGLYASTVSALCETSNDSYAMLGDKSGGNNQKTLTLTYTPSRDLGLDSGDDTVAAPYGGQPSAQFYAIPWKVDTQAAGTVTALVQLEYRVEFFARNEVAQS